MRLTRRLLDLFGCVTCLLTGLTCLLADLAGCLAQAADSLPGRLSELLPEAAEALADPAECLPGAAGKLADRTAGAERLAGGVRQPAEASLAAPPGWTACCAA